MPVLVGNLLAFGIKAKHLGNQRLEFNPQIALQRRRKHQERFGLKG